MLRQRLLQVNYYTENLVYNAVSEYNRKIKLVIILSLYKGEITDEKKLLVLTMSTLFATQIMNSNHAKASVTESVDKNL